MRIEKQYWHGVQEKESMAPSNFAFVKVYSAYRSLGRQFEEGNDVKTAIYFYEKV